MGILELLIFSVWIACVVCNLLVKSKFSNFIIATIGDTIVLGIIYVIFHMVIKHW